MKKNPKNQAKTPIQNIEKVQESNPEKSNFLTNGMLHKILIFILAFALYSNTIPNDYAIDDTIVITENDYTRAGTNGIVGLLTTDTFHGFFKTEKNLVAGGRYRPLSLIVFAIEEQIFGIKNQANARSVLVKNANNQGVSLLEMDASIGHFTNALFFGLLCLVIYLTLFSLTKNHLISLISTIIFVVHPLHTEVVANIKGLDEILVLLGSMATLYFSLKDGMKSKIMASICFFLALLSKENAAMFLFIVPMSLYFFRNRSVIDSIKSTIFLAIPFAIYFLIRLAVLPKGNGAISDDLMNNPFLKIVENGYEPFTAGEKMATIIYTLGLYLKLLIVPYPLTSDYYPRHIGIMTFGDWAVWLGLIFYVVLIYFGIKSLKNRNWVGYGILFFLITLLIVSNIFFPIGTNMGERFMFMPSLGICFAVGVLANSLLEKHKTLVISTLSIFFITFSGLTFARNFDWKDDYTLAGFDIKVSPNSAKLQANLAANQFLKSEKESDPTAKTNLLKEAEMHITKSLEINPLNANNYSLKGMIVFNLGKYQEGIDILSKAISMFENTTQLKQKRANMLREMGRLQGEKNHNTDKAIEYLQKSLTDNPDDIEALRLMGVAQGMKGNTDFVIETMQKIIKLEPQNTAAYQNLATAFNIKGNKKTADSLLNVMYKIDPSLKK